MRVTRIKFKCPVWQTFQVAERNQDYAVSAPPETDFADDNLFRLEAYGENGTLIYSGNWDSYVDRFESLDDPAPAVTEDTNEQIAKLLTHFFNTHIPPLSLSAQHVDWFHNEKMDSEKQALQDRIRSGDLAAIELLKGRFPNVKVRIDVDFQEA